MSARARHRSRHDAERHGRLAERLAAWSCRLKGFRVVAERYRTPFGEIDLVLRRGRLLVFAEVKARDRIGDALEALRPAQRQRLVQAAAIYLRDHPVHAGCAMRFDLIAVCPWRWPHHVADAWRAEAAS
ncbi:MAG: YraN family protein [Alphaproteobacteria bacterium]